jgi:hypothetical protein
MCYVLLIKPDSLLKGIDVSRMYLVDLITTHRLRARGHQVSVILPTQCIDLTC